MAEKRPRLTILILENRQMIANILADLLVSEGYRTLHALGLEEARDLLPECRPGFLLVDMGLVRPNRQAQWQELQEAAGAHGVPLIAFSCSAMPATSPDVLLLRSPSDFAAIANKISSEWRKKQPYLGMTLVERGLLSVAELEACLRVQRDLEQVGRSYPLGELLVRLGIVTQEAVDQAVGDQEL